MNLSKEFSHALQAITRGLAPRWVSQWVFLNCQLVANWLFSGLFLVSRSFQKLHVQFPRRAFALSILSPSFFAIDLSFICLFTFYAIMAAVTFTSIFPTHFPLLANS